MKSFVLFLLIFSALLGSALAHSHPAAGVIDPEENDLALVADVPTPSTIFEMIQDSDYGGFFVLTPTMHDYFTFTVRSSGGEQVEQPLHPLAGSFILMEITSVIGPDGGSFGFWEDGGELTPSNSFQTGQPTGAFRFALTETGNAGGDPYGHIHDRMWSVDTPGDYFVTFTLYDQNGLHDPSQPYVFHFQAVPEPGVGLLAILGLGLAFRRRRRG